MKVKYQFPKKWCLHINELTRDYISDFVHTKLNEEEGYLTTWDVSHGFYFHFPFVRKHEGEKGFFHSQQSKEVGYEEISFSQFEIYVVNKSDINENYDYLIPLLKNIT